MTLPVAILAGGLARRLFPLTEEVPKSLIDVAGRPFITRQLDYLRRQGVTQVVLCVGHLGELIEAVVGNGEVAGLEVRYSWDGPHPLGTGGALKQALPLLGERFLVSYGDSYLPIDFQAVEREFLKNGEEALLTVLKNGNQWDRSNVLFRGGRVIEYNKRDPHPDMEHIDYGLGALSASVLAGMSAMTSYDLGDVYRDLSRQGRLAGFEVFERFYEIGSHQGLRETIEHFRKAEET